ncbi:DUF4267 domain-containing protein [Sorangium sp. So ce394]|uniref:DUF4267 domain-containing protein n=1 Tax=unclassified Sorangium TaxID=2621164 RepID=UPI003F5BEA82
MKREPLEQSSSWKPTSPSFILGALGGAFMLFLAVNGFAQPVAAAQGFGLPLLDVGDAVFLHIKAGRDLGIGLMFVGLLALRMRTALGVVTLASSVMPLVDCLVTSTSGRCSVPYALMVHGSAAVYCVVAAVVMLWTPRPALEPHAALER